MNCQKSNKFCIYAEDCENGLVACHKNIKEARNEFLGLAKDGNLLENQIIGDEIF